METSNLSPSSEESAGEAFWNAPWCEPFWPEISQLEIDIDSGNVPPLAGLNQLARAQALQNGRGTALRFTLSDEALSGQPMAYETLVYGTGMVPTRTQGEGAWHDFFNALIWLAYPRTKSVLNKLQADSIAASGIAGQRGLMRDAITLFDESALVLAYSDESVVQALRDKAWTTALIERRSAWQGPKASVAPFVLGHALLQKLRNPYKSLCGQVFALAVNESFFTLDASAQRAVLDRKLAENLAQALTHLEPERAAASDKPYFPLPLLGIPGWWQANESAAFYTDTAVFR
jgi:Protein of unknown function (DUF3025)